MRKAYVVALFCSLSGHPALAEERPSRDDPRAFRVVFTSSTPCNDAAEFGRQLQRRTARLRPADAVEPALTFLVDLSAVPTGVRGQLVVREPGGGLTTREVPGVECKEVLSAMALIAAVLVDPLATTGTLAPASFPERASPRSSRASSSPESPSRWGLGVGQRVTAQTALAPDLTWGAAFQAAISYAVSGSFAPVVRVGGHLARSRAVPHAPGFAKFDWTGARISLCPVAWAPATSVTLRPCAAGDVAWFGASGYGVVDEKTVDLLWGAAGAELNGEVALYGPLSLGAEVGAFFPFLHGRRFYFIPDRATIHEIPAVGLSFSLGIEVHFL